MTSGMKSPNQNKPPLMSRPQTPLTRGQACFYCRRRKMRCDGARPICGPCKRANRPDDCEYTGLGRHRAQIQILEESIGIIEARIQELENPRSAQANSSTVPLSHPYTGGPSSASPIPPPFNASIAIGNQGPQLPQDTARILVDAFLPYSSEFGFFLGPKGFRDTILGHGSGTGSRPGPIECLKFAVYLCALRLPSSSRYRTAQLEAGLLSSTLSQVSVALTPVQGQAPAVVETMQTHILLAHWFFSGGRFLEGKYHAGVAVSIGVGTSLHTTQLQKDQEEERRGACWVVITIDKLWAAALKQEPMIDLRRNVSGPAGEKCVLEIPWPLDRKERADQASYVFSRISCSICIVGLNQP
ncbi:hypothetical protein HMN09_00375900 [Mycena chlorophos]|uniref:Zn(2)-C6 fungal-type domain-containing protein n=1 Tax=Mycena chlorophos TaxID=658473 RepID=A0A8H6WHB3_MYCCL|nr:hypothetical protein HMN09_00375900 [Mycena chlorophos]